MYFFYLFILFKGYYRIFVENWGNLLFNIVTIFQRYFPFAYDRGQRSHQNTYILIMIIIR